MQTVWSVVFLVIVGIVCNFLFPFILNIVGVPGALLAGKPTKLTIVRFRIGTAISTISQSYTYLIYTAFIVSWTALAADRTDVISFIIWPVSFLAVFLPLENNRIIAYNESKEHDFMGAQVVALHFTEAVTIIGYFIFVFFNDVMKLAWGWVPYVY